MFEQLEAEDFEQVVFCTDKRVGLKAIIALHSTVLGPATGGTRMWKYGSDAEAFHDVLRLSKGMTYKASMAGLDWGGGKAVIMGDSKTEKTPQMLERFGEFVERLGGTYITAKDVGIGADDLRTVKKKTRHVLGIEGEKDSSGDPSPATSWGTYHGIRACVKKAFGASSLKDLKFAVQGLGSVAYYLIEHLRAEGASVVGCDTDLLTTARSVQTYGIETVAPDAIYDVKCDVFVPCALGAVINPETITRLKAKVVAGAANNQLATPREGDTLRKMGILYAPDYVINAGGLINIYYEQVAGGYPKKKAYAHVEKIGRTISEILDRAEEARKSTHRIADEMAEERVEKARKSAKDISKRISRLMT